MVDDLWVDVRHAVRRLRAQPVLTVMAVITLAAGIGANTAIFDIIDGTLLKPLPYPRPDELVVLEHAAPGLNLPRAGAAPFLYFTYREDGRAFQDVGLWRESTVSTTGSSRAEELRALLVTDAILPMLGVQPALGRIFSKGDDAPGAPETVVLTFGYWQTRFGGDRQATGRTLLVDNRPREIIGVLPAHFSLLGRDVSIVLPFQLDRSRVVLGELGVSGLARLKPGTTVEQARADAARMIPLAIERFPPFLGGSTRIFREARLAPVIRSLQDDLVRDVSTRLWVVMGTVGVVLLVACANVANMFLVRAESRRQEFAIRAALGADATRLARDLLVESLVIGLMGGAVGLTLAAGGVQLLQGTVMEEIPRLQDVTVGGRVVLFAVILSLGSGMLFGAVPALKTARGQLWTAIRAGARTVNASRAQHRARSGLVIGQVALAVVVLVGAGLMFRTFQALLRVQPGFTRPEQIQTFRLRMPASLVAQDELVGRSYHAIVEKLAAVPGVTAVALSSSLPIASEGQRHDPILSDADVSGAAGSPPVRLWKFVSPDYTEALGGKMIAGRDFTWTDVLEGRPVAMVSAGLARELWGRPENAVGRRIRPFASAAWRNVIGVVGDVRDDGVDRNAPATVYWPFMVADFFPKAAVPIAQRSLSIIVRSGRAGTRVFNADLEKAVWSVNRNLPLANPRTVADVYNRSVAPTSFSLVMLGIAGAIALLLSLAGIYAVISYIASQRRREIGVRLALGSPVSAVTALFVVQGMRLAGVGVAVGLAIAVVVTRLMSSMVFNVSTIDPWTYAIVLAGSMAAAGLATYIPARRAAALDPVEAFRP